MPLPRKKGLVVHHDIRNENYLAKDGILRQVQLKAGDIVRTEGQDWSVRPSISVVEELPKDELKEIADPDFKPKTKSHRQYKYFDQGPTPTCTAFGTLTYLATANPFNRALHGEGGKKLMSGPDLYALIQAEDRKNGLNFSEGATVTGALEVARELGWINRYEWEYTTNGMQRLILIAPLIAGIYWYPSMDRRDAEGIVSVPSIRERTNEGHFITIRGYDVRRDLWNCPNTWGQPGTPYGGDFKIPGDLMHRLVREEGEIAIATEVDVTP
jgi:hypothetical protein